MKTLFIATVGIGTGPEVDVVTPLINSIRASNPEHLLLFVTSQSSANGKKIRTELGRTEDNTTIHQLTANEWDVEEIFKEMIDVISRFQQEKKVKSEDITADFTTGTKPMSSALTLAAFRLGIGRLKYISVQRGPDRRVHPGTERTIEFQPRGFQATLTISSTILLLRQYRFDSVINLLEPETLPVQLLSDTERLLRDSLTSLAQAYKYWDLFDHIKFHSAYKKVNFSLAQRLNEFKVSPETLSSVHKLGESLQKKEITDLAIIDLINNARRRIEEGKYDDATARLYRACEMLAQWVLNDRYRINTSAVDLNCVPEQSKKWLQECATGENGKIQIPLAKSYRLLSDYGHQLGKEFSQNKKLRGLLEERNKSILGHGIEPMKKESTISLLQAIEEEIKKVVKDYEVKSQLLRFPWQKKELT